jgi:hypothetical protein
MEKTIERSINQTDNNNFSVVTVYPTSGYTHWSTGLKMYITKDGSEIELDGDEVHKLVKSLPRTFGGKY